MLSTAQVFAISQDVKNMFSNMRVNSWTILWSNIKSSFSWSYDVHKYGLLNTDQINRCTFTQESDRADV